jgi:hypothetical protein
MAKIRTTVEQPLVLGVLDPEAGRLDREFLAPREAPAVRDGEEWHAVEVDAAEAGCLAEGQIGNYMTSFVGAKPCGAAGQKRCNPLHCRLIPLRQSFRLSLRAHRGDARK